MKEKRKKAEIVSQSAKEIIIIVRTLLINDLDNLLSFSSFFLFFTSVSYSSFFLFLVSVWLDVVVSHTLPFNYITTYLYTLDLWERKYTWKEEWMNWLRRFMNMLRNWVAAMTWRVTSVVCYESNYTIASAAAAATATTHIA